MAKKEERPISGTEKAALFVISLIAVASWFGDGVAWYQPILFFFVVGGFVVWIGDTVHKRQMQASASAVLPVVAPVARPAPSFTNPVKPRKSTASATADHVSTDSLPRTFRFTYAAGWDVRSTVGNTLDYLVTGPRAGPSKVAKAEELGVSVIDEEIFNVLVTGS